MKYQKFYYFNVKESEETYSIDTNYVLINCLFICGFVDCTTIVSNGILNSPLLSVRKSVTGPQVWTLLTDQRDSKVKTESNTKGTPCGTSFRE